MKDVSTCLDLWLRRLTQRSQLDERDVAIIRDLPGRADAVRANHDFVRLGQRLDSVCLIADGLAARFGQTREGHRQLTAIHIPGDCADLHSAVLPNAESALSALTDTIVVRIPHEAIHDAAKSSPAIARAFWRDCTVDASIAAEWLLNNGRRAALARVAHLLCELALRYEAIGETREAMRFDMTQAQMGDALGLTPVHVNRMLKALRGDGIVTVQQRRLHIADLPRLMRVGEFEDRYLHLAQERPNTGD